VPRVNDAIEDHLDVRFPVEPYEEKTDLTAGDALVLPMTTTRIDWIEQLAENAGAATAGFSGWAVDSSFRFRGNFDAAFPLSDHCDFEELCGLVAAADPEQVYTQHGSGDAFAEHLTSEGYDARTIKQNQTSLGEF
jgi:putative mRNA 3-end processing factor